MLQSFFAIIGVVAIAAAIYRLEKLNVKDK